MRMTHQFAGARMLAIHCPELTERGPPPEESAALMAAWRRDLARLLADDLSGLLAGDRLDVRIGEPDRISGTEALARIGPVAANCLLRVGTSGETALVSFDFSTAIALTDRAFGGDGRTVGGVPEVLPRSAALLTEEAATIIAAAISRAGEGDTPAGAGQGRRDARRGEVIVRSESAARLKPFPPDAPALFFLVEIANRQGCIWRAALAVAAERMVRLLPGSGRRSAPRGRAGRAPASGMASPFAEVPLPLHVVLAEFDLSLARLQTLAAGDVFPLAVGRQVPLMVGESVLAHGHVGTAEDRMAISITRFPSSSPPVSNPGALS